MYEEKNINGVLVRRSLLFPNYGTSTCGRAFRWDRERELCVGKLAGRKQYDVFRICHNNKAGWAFLHKALADCWIPNDDKVNKVEVNHIDGNKDNNALSNLEWVTKSQNQRHALETGLKDKGSDLYNSELSEDQVHLLCQRLQQGARPKDLSLEFEVSVDIVRKLRDGSTYFHIRRLYPIQHNFKTNFSEATVRWVCDRIVEGFSDKVISEMSDNDKLTTIDVKRIRHKIRYTYISNEYF